MARTAGECALQAARGRGVQKRRVVIAAQEEASVRGEHRRERCPLRGAGDVGVGCRARRTHMDVVLKGFEVGNHT
jgi:hypothetical protein